MESFTGQWSIKSNLFHLRPFDQNLKEIFMANVQTDICTVKYIDHIGIAVHEIEVAMNFFQEVFQIPPGQIEDLPDQQVRAALLPIGQTRLELLQPLSPDSPVGRYLARRGEGLHHLAFNVDNIAETLENLDARGLELVDQKPRHGLSGLIAFVHPRSVHGILTELVQTP